MGGAPSTLPLPRGEQDDTSKDPIIDVAQAKATQPRPVLPTFWQVQINLIRQVLDVFEQNGPAAAQRLEDWIKSELAK